MFKKRIFATILIVVVISLTFAGCGSKKAKNDDDGKSFDTAVTTENALEYSKLFDCVLPVTIAITPDGQIAMERREGYEFFDEALEWEDIVQVSAGYNIIGGLDKAGKVHIACYEKTAEAIDISAFNDITYICVTDTGIYGLKKDGTVVSTGRYAQDVSDWKNVKQISAGGDNKEIILGLCNDGKILVKSEYAEIHDAESWTDIVQISAGRLHVAGVKSDGTVVTCGRPLFEEEGDEGEFNVENWTDIVYVTADNQTTVGLKKDGTIVSTGYNASEKYDQWTDAIGLYQGGNSSFILKNDGTMTYSPLGEDFVLLK